MTNLTAEGARRTRGDEKDRLARGKVGHAATGGEHSTAPGVPDFPGVRTRFIRRNERPFASPGLSLPLVLEAHRDSSQAFLQSFLRGEAQAVVDALHDYGAVLLRGFHVKTEEDFEAAISSLPAFRPMGGYFMSEAGRTPVHAGSKVFHTNENRPTGGGFRLPGGPFHTENYSTTDVPSTISFWCKTPPRVGGETAISQVSRAYMELSEATRQRLENEAPCQVRFWALDAVAARYSVSRHALQRELEAIGLPLIDKSGAVHALIEKASVVQHPWRNRRSLLVNLGLALPGFNRAMADRLLPSYSGWKWAVHRYLWKRPGLHGVAGILSVVPHAVGSRKALAYHLRNGWRRWALRESSTVEHKADEGAALGDRLNAEDVSALAEAVWRQSSIFTWRRGDVLILDNLQVAHAGMPGWGPREVRAMLCNPLRFPFQTVRGVARLEVDSSYRSVHDRLCGLAGGAVSDLCSTSP